MIQNTIHWKWSNGEKYEKTNKQSNKQSNEQQNILNDVLFHVENKREEIGNKLSEREMFAQIGLNPFSQNSYKNDITNYDNYMKIKNQS
jgi:hypothetical protein